MIKALRAHLRLLESLPREAIKTHERMPPRQPGGLKEAVLRVLRRGAVHSRRKT